MTLMGLRTLYTLLAILVSTLFFRSYFSETLSLIWGVSLLVAFVLYQSWNQVRLLKAIQGDDLIGRPRRGVGVWRTIFEQLERKSKGWRQEILRS